MLKPARDMLFRTAAMAFNSRDYDSAIAACGHVLRQHPADAPVHQLLAKIYIELGRPRLATMHALSAARQSNLASIEDALDISWSLLVTGEQEEARNVLSRFAPGHPEQMRGFWGAARQLGMLELHERALAVMQAIDNPALLNANAYTLKGHLLAVTGNFEGSAHTLELALRVAPTAPLPHLLLSRLNLAEHRVDRIKRLRLLLAACVPDLDAKAMLEYALFGELDAEGDIDAAWSALRSGAAARQRVLPYDARGETATFDALIAATSALPRMQQLPDGDKLPIFIVGLPRSGTTLLERMLGNHPDVKSCGELTTLLQQFQWVEDRLWGGMIDTQAASRLPVFDAELLARRYLGHVSWRLDGRYAFTDKTPGNFMHVATILRAMPQAKIIHLHREPVDACFSNLKVLFAPDAYPYSYSFDGLATHFANYRRLMEHWHAIFPGRVLDVSYEDMVTDPRRESARILAFCGLRQSADITDVTTNTASVSTESRSQVREPIHRRNIGSWQRYSRWLQPLLDRLPRS